MQQQVAIFNSEFDPTLLAEGQIGIGINAGTVILHSTLVYGTVFLISLSESLALVGGIFPER